MSLLRGNKSGETYASRPSLNPGLNQRRSPTRSLLCRCNIRRRLHHGCKMSSPLRSDIRQRHNRLARFKGRFYWSQFGRGIRVLRLRETDSYVCRSVPGHRFEGMLNVSRTAWWSVSRGEESACGQTWLFGQLGDVQSVIARTTWLFHYQPSLLPSASVAQPIIVFFFIVNATIMKSCRIVGYWYDWVGLSHNKLYGYAQSTQNRGTIAFVTPRRLTTNVSSSVPSFPRQETGSPPSENY